MKRFILAVAVTVGLVIGSVPQAQAVDFYQSGYCKYGDVKLVYSSWDIMSQTGSRYHFGLQKSSSYTPYKITIDGRKWPFGDSSGNIYDGYYSQTGQRRHILAGYWKTRSGAIVSCTTAPYYV